MEKIKPMDVMNIKEELQKIKLANAQIILSRIAEISIAAAETVDDSTCHWKDYYLGKYRRCIDLAIDMGIISEV